MKRRILSVLFAVTLILGGCGKNSTTGQTQENIGTDVVVDDVGNAGQEDTGADTTDVTDEDDKEETDGTQEEQPQTPDKSVKTYTVNPDTTFQTIGGFGCAYTWYSDWLFKGKKIDEALDAFFQEGGMSVLRFKNEYEYDRPDYASNAETMKKYYDGACERLAKIGEKPIILMCCWSPATYLKEGGDRSGNASLRKNDKGEYCYEEYGEWWAEAVEYYRNYGIAVDYVSIQNEVDFAPDYDGCTFAREETDTQASYAKAYLAVYRAFRERFGDEAPIMIAPETMSCVATDMLGYVRPIIDACPESIGGIAHHLYVGGEGDGDTNTVSPTSFVSHFMETQQFLGEYPLWQTEYYIGHAIDTALLINNCLVYERANYYLYWSGPWADECSTFENTYLCGTYWSNNDWKNDHGWRLTADYYAMRHFSEYIRPGYVRIQSLTNDAGIASSAYLSQDGNRMVCILINSTDEERDYVIAPDRECDSSVIFQSVFGLECENEDDCYQCLGALPEDRIMTLPAYSVTTIVMNK